MSKHFIIYKTTNHQNGRYYIGMHETADIDDGYLGSGRRIKAEVKKYGRENFTREVLRALSSREEMKLAEEQLVNEKILADPLCLNLKNGGEGGGKIWSEEHRKKFIASARTTNLRGTTQASEMSRKSGETRRNNGTMASFAKRFNHIGTKWMNDGVKAVKVPKTEMEKYLTLGYQPGML